MHRCEAINNSPVTRHSLCNVRRCVRQISRALLLDRGVSPPQHLSRPGHHCHTLSTPGVRCSVRVRVCKKTKTSSLFTQVRGNSWARGKDGYAEIGVNTCRDTQSLASTHLLVRRLARQRRMPARRRRRDTSPCLRGACRLA